MDTQKSETEWCREYVLNVQFIVQSTVCGIPLTKNAHSHENHDAHIVASGHDFGFGLVLIPLSSVSPPFVLLLLLSLLVST